LLQANFDSLSDRALLGSTSTLYAFCEVWENAYRGPWNAIGVASGVVLFALIVLTVVKLCKLMATFDSAGVSNKEP
jgi:hypothetical protein